MKTRRVSVIDEWLGLNEDAPHAIVTALSTGFYPEYGRVRKDELELMTPKLKGLPVYLGHQVTPDDLVGTVTESWFETNSDKESYCAKAKIAITKNSKAFKVLEQLLEDNKCDSVSLQFKYETMGVGENVDMLALDPIELSFVEMPVCDTCKIEYAQFSKGEKDMINDLFDDDGYVRLQHISMFNEGSTKRSLEHPERILVKGIALKPGVFNDIEYKWDALKNSAPSLIGQAITVDHSQSAHDVVGQVTGAWADDHEQVIYFSGYIDDEDIAKKVENELLTAISPEVRGMPVEGTEPLQLDDVIFTGMSVVARPACKGCRLTTKSLEFVKQLGKYFEKGDEETIKAQEAENYIKDNRTNDMSTVETDKGGNTVTDEQQVKAENTEEVKETPVEEPKEQVETQEEVVAENSEAVAEAGTPPAPADGLVERDVTEKVVTEETPEETPAAEPETTEVTEEQPAELAEKPEEPVAQVKDELAEKFETLSTKYAELEKSHKALLAENIHAKMTVLGIETKSVEDLMSKSTETLNELWLSVKDAKVKAKFGSDEPKGETTTVPHVEEAPKESNPMLDTYNGMRNNY